MPRGRDHQAGLLLGLAEPSLVALLPIWLVLGAGSSLVQTPAGRLLRRSAQEGDRPTIYAAQFALSHACWLVAYPVAGWLNTGLGVYKQPNWRGIENWTGCPKTRLSLLTYSCGQRSNCARASSARLSFIKYCLQISYGFNLFLVGKLYRGDV